jgi:large subunit ribosomal protein L24
MIMERKKNKQPKLHVKKGDMVMIISGNSRGKKGRVLEVYIDKGRAIVEGANMVTKHVKPSANKPNGGIEKREAALHLSKLMVIDPSSGEPTRIGRKLNENNKLQRFSKKTGEFI